MSLPSTTKAFTIGSIRSPPDITITSRPIPNPPVPGTCSVRVLSAYASPGWPLFFDGTLSYLSFPLPFVPGSQAVGRVLSTGPDAALLRPGDLVFIDSFVRARRASSTWRQLCVVVFNERTVWRAKERMVMIVCRGVCRL